MITKRIILASTIVFILILFPLNGCKKTSNTSSNSSTASANGKVVISASWNSTYLNCRPAYTVVIGLGYNSTDVANETYFAQGSYAGSSASFTKDNLTPGIYYYRVKKKYNSTSCGIGQGGVPPIVIKSGSFTITSGQITNVSVGSLN